MSKFKAGDIVKPLPCEYGYLHPHLIAGENYTVEGYTSDGMVNVSGEFRNGSDVLDWDEDWFELVEAGENVGQIGGLTMEKDTSAETIRSNILSIREKRNDLLMEITALDKEEADCVEKLKNLGFVLHEEASSGASKEEKTVLYAEDIEADMNDPKNWKVGDFITCKYPQEWDGWFYEDELLEVAEIGDSIVYVSNSMGIRRAISRAFCGEDFKFHSRPL